MTEATKKQFKASGAILNPNEVFYASFKKWNDKHLMEAVIYGYYSVLINPSQSGKTTRAFEFLKDLEQKGTYIGVYIDMKAVIGSPTTNTRFMEYSEFCTRFLQNLIEHLPTSVSEAVSKAPPGSLQTLVSQKYCQTHLGSKKWVFFIDDIDRISLLSLPTRAAFLTKLRAFKHDSSFFLQAAFFITNWFGSYLCETLGSSAFTINSHIFADYFDEEQTNQIWQQYEQQEGVMVPESVKNHIFKLTAGAPGQFMTLCGIYHLQLQAGKGDFQHFANYVQGEAFWDEIELNPVFQDMLKPLSYKWLKLQIVNWIEDQGRRFPHTTKEVLRKNNVFSFKSWVIGFATPLVKIFVSRILNQNQKPHPIEVLKFKEDNNKLDIIEMMPDILKNLNRFLISAGDHKKMNYTDSCGDFGKKGDVYRPAFCDAFKASFCAYIDHDSILYNNEILKEIDHVFKLGEHKFAIEHCANVSLEKYEHSLKRHIEKAKTYQMKEKSIQTFVVHWTTAPLKRLKDEKELLFPTEEVQIIHIHHTLDMKRFTIMTKEKEIQIDFPSLEDIIKEEIENPKKRKHEESECEDEEDLIINKKRRIEKE